MRWLRVCGLRGPVPETSDCNVGCIEIRGGAVSMAARLLGKLRLFFVAPAARMRLWRVIAVREHVMCDFSVIQYPAANRCKSSRKPSPSVLV